MRRTSSPDDDQDRYDATSCFPPQQARRTASRPNERIAMIGCLMKRFFIYLKSTPELTVPLVTAVLEKSRHET